MKTRTLNFVTINEQDYIKLQQLTSKGVNIPLDGMDYADAYGILCLMCDLGIPLNRLYLGGGLDACKNARNLEPELPYKCKFSCRDKNGHILDIDFTVNN